MCGQYSAIRLSGWVSRWHDDRDSIVVIDVLPMGGMGVFTLVPNGYTPEGIKDPDWQTVESVMRQLDGSHSTFVALWQGDPDLDQILIGGGEGAFIVDVQIDARHYSLLNPVDVTGSVQVVADGVRTDFEARYAVPYELALKAVKWFFEHQALDPTLRWE
jgi:hypothetical protein